MHKPQSAGFVVDCRPKKVVKTQNGLQEWCFVGAAALATPPSLARHFLPNGDYSYTLIHDASAGLNTGIAAFNIALQSLRLCRTHIV
jgi:hypothetical protein